MQCERDPRAEESECPQAQQREAEGPLRESIVVDDISKGMHRNRTSKKSTRQISDTDEPALRPASRTTGHDTPVMHPFRIDDKRSRLLNVGEQQIEN